MQDFAFPLELERVPTVVVCFPVEWYRLVPILLPATPLVAPVSGVVRTSFLFIDYPISKVETVLTTI